MGEIKLHEVIKYEYICDSCARSFVKYKINRINGDYVHQCPECKAVIHLKKRYPHYKNIEPITQRLKDKFKFI